MLPWTAIQEWGQRMAVVTGLATPIYGGLAYLQLTPVTQMYVTDQLNNVRKDINYSRVDTLETKRVVIGLARNDLVREKQALEASVKDEKNSFFKGTWYRRLDTITAEIDRLDKQTNRLDERIEGMKKDD